MVGRGYRCMYLRRYGRADDLTLGKYKQILIGAPLWRLIAGHGGKAGAGTIPHDGDVVEQEVARRRGGNLLKKL